MVGTAARSAKYQAISGTGTSLSTGHAQSMPLPWAAGRNTSPTADWQSVIPPFIIDQTAHLALVRDCYLAAVERQVGMKVQSNISCVETDQSTVYRLTLRLPLEIQNDIAKLVAFEIAVHNDVAKLTPTYSGFFSLQYDVEDDKTGGCS